jgi:hypothetical protein
VLPVAVVVPPVALLPLAVVVPPVAVVMPPVALLPLAVVVPSTMRGREEGSATRGRREMIMWQPAGATRQNERRHDKTTRRRDDERAARREAMHTTTSRRDERMSRRRNERTRRGNVTTSWPWPWFGSQPNLVYDAGDNEKRLILFRVQTELVGEVAAMVIARIEWKPKWLGFGDEFEEVGFMVQKGLRTQRHHKD